MIGMLERGGKVKTMVIQGRKRPAIHAAVRQHVAAGSALYTDALGLTSALASLSTRSSIMLCIR